MFPLSVYVTPVVVSVNWLPAMAKKCWPSNAATSPGRPVKMVCVPKANWFGLSAPVVLTR